MRSFAFASILLLAKFLMTLVSLASAHPSTPGWWENPSTAIIDSEAVVNNYAPVNLGQLKHVAAMAREHLDEKLSAVGGAGSSVNALIDNFDIETSANFSPVNLGQLKAVAKPFYDRLIQVGYDTRGNLQARGYGSEWLEDYPWDPNTLPSENYAPANIGQLKMVFSFDLSDFSPDPGGTDPYGIPDAWKVAYFGHADYDGYDDPSENGYPLIYEYHHNTDPTNPAVRPAAYYTVDRSIPSDGSTVFHDIGPAVEQAKIDGVDYRIIEVAPGIYTGSANYNFTIENVKLLLISREGPDQTVIEGQGEHGHGLPIHVRSESAIVGFLFRDFDNTFMSVQDVDAGVLANCRFGGHTHGDSIAIKLTRSSVILRNIVGMNGGGVEVKNYVWPEIDYLIRVENSTFANNHSCALSVEGGRLEVRDSNFENNQGAWGAAIYLSTVEAVIENSRFIRNRATGFGGAIGSNSGDLLIVDSHFEKNISGGNGGGVRSISDDLMIVDSHFESNVSGENGGAVYASTSLIGAIEGSTFSRNRGEASGGALHWVGGSDKTITSSRFVNNQGAEGGAVYFAGTGEKDVVNSIFVGNRADMRGGAISAYVVWERYFRLNNSTRAANKLLSEEHMAVL